MKCNLRPSLPLAQEMAVVVERVIRFEYEDVEWVRALALVLNSFAALNQTFTSVEPHF